MGKTYFVTDKRLLKHKCEWDPNHIETPDRLEKILDKLDSSQILKRCKVIPSLSAKKEDILLVHTEEYYEQIKRSQYLSVEDNETLSSQYEDLYINKSTYMCAMVAAGSALSLVEKVILNPGSNGFAAIRPPGHHAGPDHGCGFCIFNNVAICAKKARKLGMKKVLIIDFDVHAAQGTQYCIEDNPNILLVSIHRYESGQFWPNLPESGVQTKYKRTINVPIQKTGLGDAEYAAFIDIFVRPMIKDFNPNFILVSCGFDASFGDREGQMAVTPAGYGYLMGTLASLKIPLVALLEGGYFLDAIPEDTYHTINALIERKPIQLPLGFPRLHEIDEKFLDCLFYIMSLNAENYPTFDLIVEAMKRISGRTFQAVAVKYTGEREWHVPFPTRNVYEVLDQCETQKVFKNELLERYNDPEPRKMLEVEKVSNSGAALQLGTKAICVYFPSRDSQKREEELTALFYCLYLPLSWMYDLDWESFEKMSNALFAEDNGIVTIADNDNLILKSLFKR